MKILFPALLATIAFAFSTDLFDVREASIASVHEALFSGTSSCREIVSAYISHIKAYNPTVNALISLNPNALKRADQLDLSLASGNITGSIFCIPILLKDNFDAIGMNTTASCIALKDSRPSEEGPVVAALRDAGVVILGKASLHDMALEGISMSSLGGQTINPYDHTRTPGGSSGGTGAAIASNFAVWGTGSDTVNSLRSPASANNLFSIRPTMGLISRRGILPNSYTQDSIGPIARNMDDLAVAFTVMASVGFDPADNATALIPETSVGVDYTTGLYDGSLEGVRLGLIEGFFNSSPSDETTPVNKVMADMVTTLENAGATIIRINESIYNSPSILSNLDVQRYEWREMVESYLQNPSLKGVHPLHLSELYSTKNFVILPSQYEAIKQALVSTTNNATYAVAKQGISSLITSLKATFSTNNLDAFIYPEQQNLVVKIGSAAQFGRNGILAAVTGVPVVTIPAGFSPATDEAPIGVPIGMEILGLPWSEKKILNIAAHISKIRNVRRMPVFANGSVEVEFFDAVPVVRPDAGNIPEAYPVGVI